MGIVLEKQRSILLFLPDSYMRAIVDIMTLYFPTRLRRVLLLTPLMHDSNASFERRHQFLYSATTLVGATSATVSSENFKSSSSGVVSLT